MNVNDKYFSFPPYISSSWENIAALHVIDHTLHITLIKGEEIAIPNLTSDEITTIFKAHAIFLEREALKKRTSGLEHTKAQANLPHFNAEQESEPLIRFGFGAIDSFGASLQHNPSQANAPDLPPEILSKIGNIAKILSPDDPNLLPKPEPQCNCFHCQIAKAIQLSTSTEIEVVPSEVEEAVSEEELKFQQWEITQTGDKLFTVVNKLDPQENYHVYLGHPVGCTCGKQGCEHILVVLKS